MRAGGHHASFIDGLVDLVRPARGEPVSVHRKLDLSLSIALLHLGRCCGVGPRHVRQGNPTGAPARPSAQAEVLRAASRSGADACRSGTCTGTSIGYVSSWPVDRPTTAGMVETASDPVKSTDDISACMDGCVRHWHDLAAIMRSPHFARRSKTAPLPRLLPTTSPISSARTMSRARSSTTSPRQKGA